MWVKVDTVIISIFFFVFLSAPITGISEQTLSCPTTKLVQSMSVLGRARGENCQKLCAANLAINMAAMQSASSNEIKCKDQQELDPLTGAIRSTPCGPSYDVQEGPLVMHASGSNSDNSEEPQAINMESCECHAELNIRASCAPIKMPTPQDRILDFSCFAVPEKRTFLGGTIHSEGASLHEMMENPGDSYARLSCWTSSNIFGPLGGGTFPEGWEVGGGQLSMSYFDPDRGRPILQGSIVGPCIKIPYLGRCVIGLAVPGEDEY